MNVSVTCTVKSVFENQFTIEPQEHINILLVSREEK